MRHDLTAGL